MYPFTAEARQEATKDSSAKATKSGNDDGKKHCQNQLILKCLTPLVKL